MSYILFTTSLLEFFTFFFGLIFYFKVGGMKVIFMFLPHVARGVVGMKIWKALPKSHDIVKQLGFDKEYDPDDENSQFQDGESKMSFKMVHKRVKLNIERIFFESYKEYHTLMKAYFGLTVLSAIMDFFAFIVIMRYYG